MREIKFRAWNKQGNKWITDRIGLNVEDGAILIYDRKAGDEHDQVYHYPDAPFYAKGCFDGVVLMQFTGIKDKNGREIYEGDIIQWGDNDGLIQEVVWNNKGFWSTCEKDICADFPSITIPENCKIIGNLYENPELLTPNPVVTGE